LKILPGVVEAIKALNTSSYLAICITNQPVIARGDVSFSELEEIHARLDTLLGQNGAYLDDLLFCPHHPHKGFAEEIAEYKVDCYCRKPNPGLLYEAASRYNIDLSCSYVIGDRTVDIAAGEAAGCMTIGVKTGSGLTDGICATLPNKIAENLLEAVKIILKEE